MTEQDVYDVVMLMQLAGAKVMTGDLASALDAAELKLEPKGSPPNMVELVEFRSCPRCEFQQARRMDLNNNHPGGGWWHEDPTADWFVRKCPRTR